MIIFPVFKIISFCMILYAKIANLDLVDLL
jgi:hypothetical protein